MILDEKEAAARKVGNKGAGRENGGNNKKKGEPRPAKKKDGLDMGGLAKFMR
jgi:hypothetical protein